MSNSNLLKSDNILGYKIVERIGAGGYGEVWRVEAPGGLQKALKILHGFHDERRAQLELKAIDKIKQLRHPFLLSLERIEVVEDQLVVITELADRSLADLFNEYVERGVQGIPRDELLEYLKQSADALDFLSGEHNLQHMDVKPENILLVGKHAKLADFGLVKNLQDCTQSLLGGLTPAYAAPELFDGRPSPQSDQYSLAIVYHEMLCGIRCFSGNTPAQLAAQHMHEQPNLEKLTKSDQLIVGRALSKKPDLRFKSCRQFVEELIQRKTILKEKKRSNIPARAARQIGTTSVLLRDSHHSQDVTQCLPTSQLQGQAKSVVLVEPPRAGSQATEAIPTLFIGIGKSATQICQKLRKRIVANYTDTRNLPSFKILCFDTDRQQLATASGGSSDETLDYSESFAIPLGKPEDYREKSKLHAGWLNRRWIYNIPKTQQTEGLRPLGRLAFVDNFQHIWQKLDESLEEMLKPESVAISAEHLSQPVATGRLRVFVVTSVAGGVGSGMALDLAYTIKLAMKEYGCNSNDVHGIFIHSCNTRERENGIAQANGYAFLSELRHYTEMGYPGEEACGIPSLEDEIPFDFPYFLSVGDNLSSEVWEQRLDSISDYLFLNAFRSAPKFFDECRELELENDHFSLRSFGIANEGLRGENFDLVVRLLQRDVLDSWLSRELPTALLDQLIPPVQEWAQDENARDAVRAHFEKGITQDSIDETKKATTDLLMKPIKGDESPFTGLWQLFRGNQFSAGEEKALWPERAKQIYDGMKNVRSGWNKQIEEAMLFGFRQRQFSMPFVLENIRQIEAELTNSRDEGRNLIVSYNKELDLIAKELKAFVPGKSERESMSGLIPEVVARYSDCLEEILIQEVLVKTYSAMLSNMAPLKERIGRLRMVLLGQLGSLQSRASIMSEIEELTGFDLLLTKEITDKQEDHCERASFRVFQNMVKPVGSFEALLLQDQLAVDKLFTKIGIEVREEVVVAGRQINIDQIVYKWTEVDAEGLSEYLNELTRSASPWTWGCGGEARVLVGIPELAPSSFVNDSIERMLGCASRVAMTTCGELLIVMECEKIELADVAFRIMQHRSDCVELASRIQSRNDVNWKSMKGLV